MKKKTTVKPTVHLFPQLKEPLKFKNGQVVKIIKHEFNNDAPAIRRSHHILPETKNQSDYSRLLKSLSPFETKTDTVSSQDITFKKSNMGSNQQDTQIISKNPQDQQQQFYGSHDKSYQNYKYPKINLKNTAFEFLTQQTPLMSSNQKLPKHNNLEDTLENQKYQRYLVEYLDKEISVTHSSNASSKLDISKKYRYQNEAFFNRMSISDKKRYTQLQLEKLDEKITLRNQPNLLKYNWQSPFAANKDQYKKVMSEAYMKKLPENQQNVYKQAYSKKHALSQIIMTKDTFADGDIDDEHLVISAIQMNQILRGYGPRLRTILDRNKHFENEIHRETDNPKYLSRAKVLMKVKNHKNKYLDMVKEWNSLLAMDKLQSTVLAIKNKTEVKKDNEFGTMSSLSHFKSFQGFSYNVNQISQKSIKLKDYSTNQQATPISQIVQPLNFPQLTNSNSFSQGELDLINVDPIIDDESDPDPHQDSSLKISKDTFLTFFVPFWNILRKEDYVVDRIFWALSRGKNAIDFNGFHEFYKLFVYQDSSYKQRKEFVIRLIMYQRIHDISFIDVQHLINMLCAKIDNQTIASAMHVQDSQADLISFQILENIVEKIHRPQQIDRNVIVELVNEDKIPADTIIRLLYDDQSL